jgi:hypothetical protein
LTTNSCVSCLLDADCKDIAGKGVCSSGTCVQCTPTNEKACNNDLNSCNPKTKECTTTAKGSVDVCKACLADSECVGGNLAAPISRCVPMTFGPTAVAHGNYCLQRRASQACAPPLAVLVSAVSASGTPAEDYCGLSQSTTTCEAVLDMKASKVCPTGDDDQCGMGLGGVCKLSSSTSDYRCTIPCSETVQCTSVRTCSGTPSYCQ